MATKPTVSTVSSDAKWTTTTINTALTALKDAFANVLGTDGTSGSNNTMTGDLDMNGNTIRNAVFDSTVAGVSWQGDWTTATDYVVNDLVYDSGTGFAYICVVDHTSGTFATDYSSAYWEIFASSGGVSHSAIGLTIAQAASASAVRTAIGTVIGTDVLAPDGDGSSLTGIEGSIVGEVRTVLLASAPSGWLLLDGSTIGDSSSGADFADDALYVDLFTALWDNLDNAYAAVSSGRGASAAADFAAHKTLTLPDGRGRSPLGAGTGSGLTARTLGAFDGEEDHTLTAGESGLPAHSHNFNGAGSWGDDNGANNNALSGSSSRFAIQSAVASVTAQNASSAHNTMHPWLAMNYIIKY